MTVAGDQLKRDMSNLKKTLQQELEEIINLQDDIKDLNKNLVERRSDGSIDGKKVLYEMDQVEHIISINKEIKSIEQEISTVSEKLGRLKRSIVEKLGPLGTINIVHKLNHSGGPYNQITYHLVRNGDEIEIGKSQNL